MEGQNVNPDRLTDLVIQQKVNVRLEKGTLLNGKVMKILTDGMVLMDFGSFRAKTEIKVPVVSGEQLRLTVVQPSNPMILSLSEDKTSSVIKENVALFPRSSHSGGTSGHLQEMSSEVLSLLKEHSSSLESLLQLPSSLERKLASLAVVLKLMSPFIDGDRIQKHGESSIISDWRSLSQELGEGLLKMGTWGNKEEIWEEELRIATGRMIERMERGEIPMHRDMEIFKSFLSQIGDEFGKFLESAIKPFKSDTGSAENVSDALEKRVNRMMRHMDLLIKNLDWLHLSKEDDRALLENMVRLPKLIEKILSLKEGAPFMDRFPLQVKDALTSVMTHFLPPVDISGKGASAVQSIQKIFEENGQFFERKMEEIISGLSSKERIVSLKDMMGRPEVENLFKKDLKPNLLIIRNFLDEAELHLSKEEWTRPLLSLKRGVEVLLNEVNRQQYDAVMAKREGYFQQPLSFWMPFKYEDRDQNVRFRVIFNKKQKNTKDRPPQVSILLDLDRVGLIRADLLMFSKDLSLTFFVKDHKIESWMNKHLKEVEEKLADRFHFLRICVNVSEKKIAEFDGGTYERPEKGIVDIKI